MKARRIEQPDTDADRQLKDCLLAADKRSFVMVAGAGSGKTTSLIKALATVVRHRRTELRRNRQRVACITYTEIAAGEIWGDVGNDPLVHVSTIHSFMWMLVRSFQSDIRRWVNRRIEEKLGELRAAAASFGPRVQQRTKEKNKRDIERYERERERIASVPSFTYGTGSNYPRGILRHDDVLKTATEFLSDRPLFRTLLAQQFPLVFVDESQDTTAGVVQALKSVELQNRATFCLGFFGDPMQRIYPTGVGPIAVEGDWLSIPKPENFRCATSVLHVANAIRRDGDDLVQTRGRMREVDGALQAVAGTARIFVLPAASNRDQCIGQVREWVARENADEAWRHAGGDGVKVLVIVHRMAAERLGFGGLYAALNDKAPDAFKNGFLDATAWPLRPFIQFVLPLSVAMRDGREFEAMSLLRLHCPELRKETLLGKNVPEMLQALRKASLALEMMMNRGARHTIRDVLELLRDSKLTELDPRILAYLEQRLPPADADAEGDEEDAGKEVSAMEAFLACPGAQLWGYNRYLRDESPFSTQQGVKGAEFERVLVILDDEEGTHNQFSYDKYFGIKELSDRDRKNIEEGKETSVERTRRLFYVCCTRALQDLVVVLFAEDAARAAQCIRAMKLFREEDVLNETVLR